jgi:hypothetical protein
MDLNDLSPSGDLPPNHPLVLEALKGIISGPISELRTKVDNLIINPSSALKKGGIDYENILPQSTNYPVQSRNTVDDVSFLSNQILNTIAPIQYDLPNSVNVVQQHVQPLPRHEIVQPEKSDQMELPLFKSAQVDDLYKKLFDIEKKIDIILKHVKNDKDKK